MADHKRQHTVIMAKKGPLDYGLYWYPFFSQKYVDTYYGGSMYASVQIREIEGVDGSGYAEVDAACMKYLEGTLSVKESETPNDCPTTWYTFPLIQQVRVGDDPFWGTPEEAVKVLPPGRYISRGGYKLGKF
jgi:hypothetical protein